MKTPSLFLAVGSISGAALGVAAVLIGHVMEWPNFSDRTGYLGTHYMDSILYAMGNDTLSLAVISSIWAVYGALIGFLMVLPFARQRDDR